MVMLTVKNNVHTRLKTPFPALSSAQRLSFDLNGYVVLKSVFSEKDVEEMKLALYDIRARGKAVKETGIPDPSLGGATVNATESYTRMNGIGRAHERMIDFITHPYLVGMAEEVMGCAARINETNSIINKRTGSNTIGWHRGADVQVSTHYKKNLFHCNFVKTLINLTDFGPDDGGTVCVAGSHKLDIPYHQLKPFIDERPELVHQFIAPKGSVFLFAESLIHGTGIIRTDNERVLLINGFASRMMPYWDEPNSLTEESFLVTLPEHLRMLCAGFAHWTREQKYRNLMDTEESCDHALGSWRNREAKEFIPNQTEVDIV